jgi:Spy/CpxP family protein refolding chaperone
MRKLALALAVLLPAVALAHPHGPGGPPGQGRGEKGERSERRMRLARTLGLAEALDLDAEQALRLSDLLTRFDARRAAARKQLGDARLALRKAAQGEKATAQEVDQALRQIFEARAQLAQVDRETIDAIPKDLTPEKRARAALFLTRFQERSARMRALRFGEEDEGLRGPRGPGDRRREMLGFQFSLPELPPLRVGPLATRPELCAPDEDCIFLGGDDADDDDEMVP